MRSCGIAILKEKQKINSVAAVSGRLAVNIESRDVGGRQSRAFTVSRTVILNHFTQHTLQSTALCAGGGSFRAGPACVVRGKGFVQRKAIAFSEGNTFAADLFNVKRICIRV